MNEESYYKRQFGKLQGNDFPGALKIAHSGAMSHSSFQHYTTLDVLHAMLKKRQMWLSRLDAPSLNDGNESGKYGTRGLWKRTYVGCFSYGRAESAAMWGMYCVSRPDAVRLLISPQGMRAWNEYLSKPENVDACPVYGSNSKDFRCRKSAGVEYAGIADVLYAAVKNQKNDAERANDLYWNFTHAKIDNLHDWIKNRSVEGFLKDYEWRYEQETRLYVRLASVHQGIAKLAVHMPDDVFEAMSIVLSPWLDKDCAKCYSERIKRWFRDQHIKVPHIRPSYLTGTIRLRN